MIILLLVVDLISFSVLILLLYYISWMSLAVISIHLHNFLYQTKTMTMYVFTWWVVFDNGCNDSHINEGHDAGDPLVD